MDGCEALLISCYELGHAPVGIAWPLAFLARAGVEADAIDVAIDPLDDDRLEHARFVGISVPMHTALALGIRVAQRVRAVQPRAHVCFYGLYAPLQREMLLSRGLADSVLGGECEELLAATARAVVRGQGHDDEGAVARAPAPELARLRFPVPARDKLAPLDRYARLEHGKESRVAGYVEASRGCLHMCTHCPIPAVYDGRFFVVPQDVVLADIDQQVKAGARHITFGDPDFLNGPRHAIAIARALHERHPGVTFDVTTKVEHIVAHRDLLPELARLGCVFVVSAVESLSDTVLEHLDKGHTRADVEEAFRIVEGAGIALRPSLLPFTPWSTLEDYLDLLGWIASERLLDRVDPIQLSIRLLVPPGSLLVDSPAMKPHLRGLASDALSFLWTHPDARMDALQADVTRIVDDASQTREAPAATLRRVIERAFADAPSDRSRPDVDCCDQRAAAPRLSESWFCCAEPSSLQKRSLSVVAK